jgi:flagellar basal body-associated protein FliL
MADVDFGIKDKDKPKDPEATKKLVLRVSLLAGVIIVFGGGGFMLGKLLKPDPDAAAAAQDPIQQEAAQDDARALANLEESDEYTYHELEPITVTLNERRGNRYLRTTLRLKVSKADASIVEKTLEKNQAEIQDWMLRYLSSLTVTDVLGQRNINRIRRRIRDEMNELLWPNSRPRIEEVLLKEFNVS